MTMFLGIDDVGVIGYKLGLKRRDWGLGNVLGVKEEG